MFTAGKYLLDFSLPRVRIFRLCGAIVIPMDPFLVSVFLHSPMRKDRKMLLSFIILYITGQSDIYN